MGSQDAGCFTLPPGNCAPAISRPNSRSQEDTILRVSDINDCSIVLSDTLSPDLFEFYKSAIVLEGSANELSGIFRNYMLCFPAVAIAPQYSETKSADKSTKNAY
ncbi:MAG: hypothetical protein JGK24_09845 [Microcoleus sp. PH2017_29_MFU_D_A]|jgi:hypothetical protein|uniref:hypothetical protein n=1 Tax=unclassified Microcoleus TaxID=2642155 RepID=UPI001D44E369|nr:MULTISPECIES: hypothetical protein [unclassified Microcoleus]MCC3421273.1 hypothetical protein [Microcoleus sp. PH2017_07_MST_O_A]MCC3429138.1 hypothetical protein [Microcoleus sp. PH2017_04_SCI_O_A]MCC3442348.1 hypothetical protein [Microcoleus sp. PH2017_03_ELD_O_A]MCC3469128.1 hypothetical protein [Microcoleus sp. PH2017_06_SFM_O_A]MCC3501477.1 hypothetical protein [Microcoleus sp. PH2017_19_SFW_U_A]MCC3510796.1 hypothetical protein [Microcoleus sp. PH2017_17_BER_D_A]TAE16188.1 MAG: hy